MCLENMGKFPCMNVEITNYKAEEKISALTHFLFSLMFSTGQTYTSSVRRFNGISSNSGNNSTGRLH